MVKILIFIKQHFPFVWKIIDLGNGAMFSLFFKARMETILLTVLNELAIPPFSYRRLSGYEAETLYNMIDSQEASDLKYFNPHGFDLLSIKRQLRNPSFLMMGSFDGNKMVGYFFLRFFVSRQCFVGRLIDKDFRGKGIGSVMNRIMYETAWRMRFRCLSTISRNNSLIMRAHARNASMVLLKELQQNYMLVEFIRETQSEKGRDDRLIN